LPLIPGRTYDIVVHDLNPLCYAYTAEITVKEDNADLSKIIAALTPSSGAAPADNKGPVPVPPSAPPPAAPAHGIVLGPPTPAEALEQATEAVESAEGQLRTLRGAVTSVEGLVREVNSPTCSRTASFASLEGRWNAMRLTRSRVADAESTIGDVRTLLRDARRLLGLAAGAPEVPAVTGRLDAALAEATSLATKTATLVPELLSAAGAMASASEQKEFRTQAYLPAGTSSVDIVVRATELKPKTGEKTVATTELKSSLAMRRGMRVFLSTGFMGSLADLHDFERSNRACPVPANFTCETTYSTYVDRAQGDQGFAFSPVLQANVAFRDFLGSGVSMHTSAGVAARSVNGAVSPEFIVGVGGGFLDRLLFTGGLHVARDEKLLLGNAFDVASGPVSDKITGSDAVSVVWRTALMATITFRLN
jgi:hypothetical protein